MKKGIAVLALSLLLTNSAWAEEINYAEGWFELPHETQASILIGFYNGVSLCYSFIVAESYSSIGIERMVFLTAKTNFDSVLSFTSAYYSIETNKNNNFGAAFMWALMQAYKATNP